MARMILGDDLIDTSSHADFLKQAEGRLKELFRNRVVSDSTLALIALFPWLKPLRLPIMYLSGKLFDWIIEKTIIGLLILEMRSEVNAQVTAVQRELARYRRAAEYMDDEQRLQARERLAKAYRDLIKLDMA